MTHKEPVERGAQMAEWARAHLERDTLTAWAREQGTRSDVAAAARR